MSPLQYRHDHECDVRSCPAAAIRRFVFLLGSIQTCNHHGNALGIGPHVFGFVTEEGMDAEVSIQEPAAPAPSKARKIPLKGR